MMTNAESLSGFLFSKINGQLLGQIFFRAGHGGWLVDKLRRLSLELVFLELFKQSGCWASILGVKIDQLESVEV